MPKKFYDFKNDVKIIFFEGDDGEIDKSYNYMMLGNVYEKNNEFIKISFGGLLMKIEGELELNGEIGFCIKNVE